MGQICYVGDPPSKTGIVIFSDASFAGDLKDSKSTSGAVLCLVSPNTFVLINWLCKKQTAAEDIGLDAGTRREGLPALLLWDLAIQVFGPSPQAPTTFIVTIAEWEL